MLFEIHDNMRIREYIVATDFAHAEKTWLKMTEKYKKTISSIVKLGGVTIATEP